ncbi:MAG TPA: 16S rRNA (adenine(1518)-N(6)/adenine(1519)-N(6))-dimethyltransferase RsmA [Polyangia bacterium]|nr:16S rRNA (adenine(1518)-N(6)/adenine(1519)-N(6))-dimethyltransferase RsmA [Polyangia bacterium]
MSAPGAAPEDPRRVLRRYDLGAKKSWGQNFLVARGVVERIVAAADAGAADVVLEIGAGLGTLTATLAAPPAPAAPPRRVIAVEREPDMLMVLRGELAGAGNVEIVAADAAAVDLAAVAAAAGRPLIVVGNLPYQIASPILFRLLETRGAIARIVVMLQKEMADRIVAPPGEKAYGALSVMVRFYGTPKLVCRVRAGGFVPAPRVDSAVLRIVPHAARPAVDEQQFSRVVHAAFGQRRKTLRNALSAAFDAGVVDGALAAASIDGQRRGETLSVDEFVALTKALDA